MDVSIFYTCTFGWLIFLLWRLVYLPNVAPLHGRMLYDTIREVFCCRFRAGPSWISFQIVFCTAVNGGNDGSVFQTSKSIMKTDPMS